MNSSDITRVHTGHLWDSHVFTLFVCGMQRIHKHKKVGCALTESLVHRLEFEVSQSEGTAPPDFEGGEFIFGACPNVLFAEFSSGFGI